MATQSNRLNLAVIFGGCSSEYDVSLNSASAVIQHLDAGKYNVIPIGITRTGKWLRYDGPIKAIADDTWHSNGSATTAYIAPCRGIRGITGESGQTRLHAALPILHGKNGEDGTIQGLLELAGIPVVGCGTLSSALCMDKMLSHSIAKAAGIKTAPGFVTDLYEHMRSVSTKADAIGYPLFVKPLKGGSSLGVSCVHDPANLPDALADALSYDSQAIVEARIDCRELGCAIMGSGEQLVIGQLDEIELTGDYFDYTEKYNLITSRIHLPARVDSSTTEAVKNAAAKVYNALNCSGFARVDMFLTDCNEIYFNEVNTIPGFTAHSRFPQMLGGIGYSFTAMLDELIRTAVPS